MSVASKNLFAVLGEEEASVTTPETAAPIKPETPVKPGAPIKDVVKKHTSSKKADENPHANPARAGKKSTHSGNEAAFRDNSVGRSSNQARPTGAERSSKPPRKTVSRPDRHSQTGKTDSDKKLTKGWGDNRKKLADENAAEVIAKEDAVEEENEVVAPVEEEEPTKTLEEYLAQQSAKSAEWNSARTARRPNEGADDDKWAAAEVVRKSDEELFAGAQGKALRTKHRKEKTVLEPEVTFTPPSSNRPTRARTERSERGERGGERGERGGERGRERGGERGRERGGERGGPRRIARGGAGPRAPRGPTGVNIGSTDEFPSLGA